MHAGIHPSPRSRHPLEQTPPRAYTPLPRSRIPLGADTLPTGADTLHRSKPSPSGRAVHVGRYGQQAGGVHPTGMHTCTITLYVDNLFITICVLYWRIQGLFYLNFISILCRNTIFQSEQNNRKLIKF